MLHRSPEVSFMRRAVPHLSRPALLAIGGIAVVGAMAAPAPASGDPGPAAPHPDVQVALSFSTASPWGDTDLRTGDELTYSLVVENQGDDTATGTVLFDAVPTGTTYLPGSLTLDGDPLTDADDADAGRFSPADGDLGAVHVDLGDIAPAADGGPTHLVTFTVVVDASAAGWQALVNGAQTSYRGATSGVADGTVTNIVLGSVRGGFGDLPPTLVDHVVSIRPTADAPSLVVDVLTGAQPAAPEVLSLAGWTHAARGAVAAGPDGSVVYTPDADFAGDDLLTYTVTGETGNATTATVLVEVLNDAPAPQADAVTLDGAEQVTVDVLTNDTDPNGDVLTVRTVGAGAGAVASGTLPTSLGGRVTFDGTTLRYAAPAGGLEAGRTDTFDYVVADPRGATAVGSVVVAAGEDAGTGAGGGATDTATTAPAASTGAELADTGVSGAATAASAAALVALGLGLVGVARRRRA